MDTGSGTKTILFVHGLANYAAAWKYQLSGLSSTYRCIAVDLPGNGFSSRGDFPYSMFFYAECIRQFIEQHKLTDVILCGHSMGAQVSTIVALRYPHLVSKLVLVAPAGIERFSGTDILFMQAMLNIGDFLYADEFHLETAIRDSFETASPDMPKMMEEMKKLMENQPLRQWRSMTIQSIHGMLNEQVHSFLSDIRQPTLLLFAEKDRLIPNRFLHPTLTVETLARQCEALFQQPTVHVLKGTGHFLHLEQASLTNQFIRDFVL